MWKSLVGKTIKVDRGGPESRIGKLMAVLNDHLVLLTEMMVWFITIRTILKV